MIFAVVLPYVIYGIGAAFLPKNGGKGPVTPDANAPTTVSFRGATIPYLIGRRRVGAVFGWAGDRQMGSVQTGGGGGGKGAGGGGGNSQPAGQPVYSEAGWHILSVGPVKKLHNVWSNGKLIFSGTIDSATSPSGSQFDCSDGSGTFRIYWGEFDQDGAIDTDLGTWVDVPSKFPHVCYVFWTRKELGNSPRWPLIEYEIESVVTESAALVGTSPTITGTGFAGPNPAHVIYQLLFGRYPLGKGEPLTYFDTACFEKLGTLLNTEKLAVSVMIQDGEEMRSVIDRILLDVGAILTWDANAGKYKIKLIRGPETPIALADGLVLDPLAQIETAHGERPADRIVYTFADRTKQYRSMAIAVDDDAQATYVTAQRSRSEQISTAVDLKVAAKIAARRSQESLGAGPRYTFKLGPQGRLLYPGCLVKHASWPQPVRVTEVSYSPSSEEVSVSGIGDNYSTTQQTFEGPDSSSASDPVSTPADDDLMVRGVEIPAQAQPVAGVCGLWVPHVRADKWIGFANTFFSRDGSSAYAYEGTDNQIHNGGQLLDALPASGPYEIAQGPTFTKAGVLGDYAYWLDLSASPDENAWRAGRQMVAINGEIFFCGKITAITGDTFRLDKLIRARYDTVRETHSIGDDLYIFLDSDVRYYDPAFLQPGKSVFIKEQPVSPSAQRDLGSCTAVTITLDGKNIVPMAISCLRTVNPSPVYHTGEDIEVVWNYSTQSPRQAGAGMSDGGDAWPDSPPDGEFKVRVYDAGFTTLKRTIFSTLADWTYTNAQLIADFGSEVDFGIDVRNVIGGLESKQTRLVVELD